MDDWLYYQDHQDEYRYRLTSTGDSSHKYGLCQRCKTHASEVFLQTEERTFFLSEEPDNPKGWTQYKCHTLFGHQECLIIARRGQPLSGGAQEEPPNISSNGRPDRAVKAAESSDISSAVPQSVIDHVKSLIQTLEALTIARQSDATFNGEGRYEAEAYLNRMAELEAAWRGIAIFEQLCEKNGVNPATVYTQVGEPARLSEGAKEWIADFLEARARRLDE